MYYSEIIAMFAEIINLKIKNMLIYNTTFQVDDEVHDNFLIWIKESYIPEVEKHGALRAPRICRVLRRYFLFAPMGGGRFWCAASLASGSGCAAQPRAGEDI